ncbi:MAG TPA: 6-phosphofructokinase [Planctomycetaceae bacterium]|nr:6-phosphofructokinase [Planctomycetaceae bacterium]
MKRLAILTAGGDTPALNATLHGAVTRANQLGIEVFGLLDGFAGLLDDQLPHVPLNPLLATIPELDPCRGGTILGSSRTYLDGSNAQLVDAVAGRLDQLGIQGLIAVGGDGTLNGLQPLSERLPCVLAPKTIDNDLGLNSPDEPVSWTTPLEDDPLPTETDGSPLDISRMVNFATPGFATAVFVVVQAIRRIRTTAESHRRVAIVEVMGRQSGYIALGSSYGQPDLVVIPEVPLEFDRFAEQVGQIYRQQRHVVAVIGEGIVDESGQQLGATSSSVDPAGNVLFRGAAEALKQRLAETLPRSLLADHASPEAAIFTRKIGHTQRGGRPVLFDRFHAARLGGQAVDLLHQGRPDHVATLQWSPDNGFAVDGISASDLRDRWGTVRPRLVHQSFFDGQQWRVSARGQDYLRAIFTDAVGADDVEHLRGDLFDAGHLATGFQSVNVKLAQRVRRVS